MHSVTYDLFQYLSNFFCIPFSTIAISSPTSDASFIKTSLIFHNSWK
uniref:Uncharacterized protein n=1 Tax=Arundo donax TaxID=35708 RepID=A0A0A9FCR1_ARUDO